MENPILMNTWKNDVERVDISSTIDCLRSIELNLSNVCNFRCPFCPQSLGWKTSNPTFMTMNIISKIKEYLNEINYKGYICTAGFGEPSLNPNFKQIIKELSDFKIVIVSNGTMLTKEDWEEIESYGENIQIKISVHEWDKVDQYKEKFENTKAWFRNHDMKNPQMNIYNRAGYLDTKKVQLNTRCNYPFYKVFIDTTGNYLQCEADWNHHSETTYNIFNTSIYEYFVNILEERRKGMVSPNGRQCFKCCEICDINGQMIGDNFVEWWKNDKERRL